MRDQGITVTVAYPGVVDTEIRRRGFDAAGGRLGVNALKDEDMMPVDVCARLILDGIAKRKREVVMTRQARFGRFLRLLAPGLTERMARNAVKGRVPA